MIDAVDDECEILTVEDYEDVRDNYQESNAANMTYEEWQEDVAYNWYLSCQCGACMARSVRGYYRMRDAE